jgi:putative sporulation protein YtxC
VLLITIAVKHKVSGDLLCRCLEDDLMELHPEDAPQIHQYSYAQQSYVVCELAKTDPARNVQIYYLASALTDFIVNHYEPDLLIGLINRDHPSSTKDVRLGILDETQAILQGSSRSKLAEEARLQSKANIMYTLLDYLNAEHLLILDGFVLFRLWEYRDYLHHLTRMAAESIRRERAHREFISLLKSFVELQEPRMEVAHVIAGFYSLGKGYLFLRGQ